MSHNVIVDNARAYSVNDAQTHRPNSVTGRGLLHHERVQLKKSAQNGFRVGQLNIGSMTGRGRELADLMRKRKIDVLCVQETRWKGNKAKELGDGYKLLYSGANAQGRNGVGIVLSGELKSTVTEVCRKNDRIMRLKICCGGDTVNIISAYAPQGGCTEEEKGTFWSEMDGVMQELEEHERVIVGADLNGHVGSENYVIGRVHGGHGIGERNPEGESIVDFAMSFDMAIVNTYFTKKREHLITYKSGGICSQIDYFLYKRSRLLEVKNCKVIPGDHVAPQHRLVCMDLKLKRERKSKMKVVRKIRWYRLLKEGEKRREFKRKVLEEIDLGIEDVQEWWRQNASVIRRLGKEQLGETSGRIWEEKETWWWNENIAKVVKEKKEAKKRWEDSHLSEDRERLREKNKEVKKMVAQAKARSYEGVYDELETKEGLNKMIKLAKTRHKSTKDITHIKQIKDENGTVLKKEEDILKRWIEYFEKLLNEENERLIRENGQVNIGMVIRLSRNEVLHALKKMKNGKATGPDLIPVEVWKAIGEEGVDILYDLMVKILEQEKIPEEWRESILVPIFKGKGDVQECSNYRGIKLMSHTLKILERIIDGRLREEVDIGKEQLGFMKGNGTSDGIFCLRQVMEKFREKQRDLHVVFIDLEKAYDRVPRQEIWRSLREKMVPEKYVRMIQEMYRNAVTRVRSSVGETDGFEVKVGLHQGSALSPFIFNIVMDVITRNVRETVPWTILYADDIVLCAERREDLEIKLERWRAALEERGMRISRSKTEYMCTSNDEGSIRMDGEELKRVQKFKYLGSIVDASGLMDEEVKHRVQAGWNNWRSASGVLCDKKVPLRLKGKFHRTVIRPAMLYGTETSSMKKTEEKRMDVAEMRMLRWMCGLTREDRIRNEYIRGSTKVVEISKKIQEGRLRWYGHLLRRDEDHVGRCTMEMKVQGRRKRGRPRKRWRDCVRDDLQLKGITEEEAQDRNKWRRLIQNGDPI